MSEYRFLMLHRILVVCINCLIIGSLFVAMYRASLTPDDFNHTFFKTIGTLFLLILMIGVGGKRILNRHRPLIP